MKFEIDKNSAGQFIWRLKAVNGKILATAGESYVRKNDAEHGINLVKGTPSLSQYTFYQDASRQWRWRLDATNGQVIAVSSESYWNRSDCEAAANLAVSTNASTPVVDLTAATAARW
jgi:uncharacterized protein YegP (UPF0339 family)